MANSFAIAMATAGVSEVIRRAFPPGVLGPKVTFVHPSDKAALPAPGVNLFLYRVVPSAQRAPEGLPLRSADGALMRRPRALLELELLVSFYGDEGRMEPARLLAAASAALEATPMLTRQLLSDVAGMNTFNFLAAADLQDDRELVRITPLKLSIDELSRLWGMFPNTPYQLSTAYRVAVVQVDAPEAATPALPVLQPMVGVAPFRPVILQRVEAEAGAQVPIRAGTRLRVVGSGLAPDTLLQADGQDLLQIRAAPQGLTADLPAGIRAGLRQLVARDAATQASSNPLPLFVRPAVTAAQLNGAQVRLTVSPPVGAAQRVELLLDPVAGGRRYVFLEAKATPPVDTATPVFDLPGVVAGAYSCRVVVDGVDSIPDVDPNTQQFAAPQVVVP